MSGGVEEARQGKLVTMVGGEKEDLDRVWWLIKCYSVDVQLMGPAGSG